MEKKNWEKIYDQSAWLYYVLVLLRPTNICLYYWLKNIRLYHSVWTYYFINFDDTCKIIYKVWCTYIYIYIQNNYTTCLNEINGDNV